MISIISTGGTAARVGRAASVPAGGADMPDEYRETLDKARAMLEALGADLVNLR